MCGAGATPIPARDSVAVELDEDVAKFNTAATDPLVCGEKMTLNGTVCPAAIVSGRLNPLKANSELLLVTAETVRLPPLAVMLLDKVALFPTVTLPKFKLPGATPSCPRDVPVPESATATFDRQYFEDTEKLPVVDPAVSGANARVRVTLCLGERVIGRANPIALKPLPVMLDL